MRDNQLLFALRRLENNEESHYVIDVDQAMCGWEERIPCAGWDVLFIPERRRVLVFGEVRRRLLSITATTRVLDAVGQAGGFTEGADAAVQFTKEIDGKTQTDILDLKEQWKQARVMFVCWVGK